MWLMTTFAPSDNPRSKCLISTTYIMSNNNTCDLFADNAVPMKEKEERARVSSPAPLFPKEKERRERAQEKAALKEGPAATVDVDIDAQRFMELFNQIMAKAEIPQISSLRGRRLSALRARCAEYGKLKVVEVLRKAAASSFLNGHGARGWRANIDWLLNADNFVKVMEGNYTDTAQKLKQEERQARAEQARIIEQQIHEELHRRLDEQRQHAVTYEEYQRMKAQGTLKPLNPLNP